MWRRFLALLLDHRDADVCGPSKDLVFTAPTLYLPPDASYLTVSACLADRIKVLQANIVCLEHGITHVRYFSRCIFAMNQLGETLSTELLKLQEQQSKANLFDPSTLACLPLVETAIKAQRQQLANHVASLLARQRQLHSYVSDPTLCLARLEEDLSALVACHTQFSETVAGIRHSLGQVVI
jgi:hypothetical protein